MPYKEMLLTQGQDFPVDVLVQDNRRSPVLVAPHWHECSEILYAMAGESRMHVDGRDFPFREGELLVLHEGDVHGTVCPPDADVRILVVKFLPSLLSGSFSHFADTRYALAFLNRHATFPVRIAGVDDDSTGDREGGVSLRTILYALLDEFTHKREGYELAVRGWIQLLAARLVRSGAIGTGGGLDRDVADGRLNAVFRHVEAHYPEPLRLSEAAKVAGMSPTSFSRWFHRNTGRTFKAYLDFVRVCEVERRLLAGGTGIAEAAYACGYTNIPSFNRVFRRVRGYAPSHARMARTAKKS